MEKSFSELRKLAKKTRVKFPHLRATVTKQEGYCYHMYKVGDTFDFFDFTHPPKDFCLGAVHSMFPCMYALTFGATFPFMENTKSIRTTCPDGKKVEFLIELVDEEGKVIEAKRQGPPPGPNPRTMDIEVKESTGKCFYKYNVGDKVTVKGLKPPEGFCGAAYHMLFPVLFGLNFGATFPFMEDPNSLDTPTCPDGGHVIFKVTRRDSPQEGR
ncbi:MAG: TIGR04076 family protein [Deltaproteobacteria bacterium]